MEKLDPYGAPAQYLLAQKGVKVDAAEPRLLLALARGLAGLIVRDDQLSVFIEFKPVNNPPQTEGLAGAFSPPATRLRVLSVWMVAIGGLLGNGALSRLRSHWLVPAVRQTDIGLEPKLRTYYPDRIGVFEDKIVTQQFVCFFD